MIASLIENKKNKNYGRMLIVTSQRRTNLRQDRTKDMYDLFMGFIRK